MTQFGSSTIQLSQASIRCNPEDVRFNQMVIRVTLARIRSLCQAIPCRPTSSRCMQSDVRIKPAVIRETLARIRSRRVPIRKPGSRVQHVPAVERSRCVQNSDGWILYFPTMCARSFSFSHIHSMSSSSAISRFSIFTVHAFVYMTGSSIVITMSM